MHVDSLLCVLAGPDGPRIAALACAAHRLMVRRYGRTSQTEALGEALAALLFR